MEPITMGLLASAAIAGGASIYGGMQANRANLQAASAANAAGLYAQDRAQEFNFDQAQRDRTHDWDKFYAQAFMNNTAYQRSMQDMRAAGLNPILASARGGLSGASTATGGAPHGASSPGMTPGAMPRIENVLGPAVSTAFQTASAVQGIQTAQEQIGQIGAQTRLLEAQQHQVNANTGLQVAQTAQSRQQERLIEELQRTEAERQANLRAQSGLAGAQTELTGQQRQTENARTYTEQQRGALVGAQANQAALEARRFADYGPRTRVGDAAAAAEAIGNRIAAGIGASSTPVIDNILRWFR